MNNPVQGGTVPDKFLCESCQHAKTRKGAVGEYQIICHALEEDREVKFRVVECNSYLSREDAKATWLREAEKKFIPKAWCLVATEEGRRRLIPPGMAAAMGMTRIQCGAPSITERQAKIARLEAFENAAEEAERAKHRGG